jgi:hypothetical protein
MRDEMTWTRPKLEQFEKALAAATGDVFEFEGHEFVKGYAKYLIEYLDGRL